MLTSIYYYNHYRPYLLKTNGMGGVSSKRPKIASKEQAATDSYKVLMNKSLKNDIVSYARDVSSSVVGTKNAARNTVRDMEDFNKNTYKRGYQQAKKWIEEDLEYFTEQYNHAVDFLSNQKHSQSLKDFAGTLYDKIDSGIGELEGLAFSMDDNNKLTFNKEAFNNLDEETLHRVIGQTISIFSDIYEDSSQVLTEPLTEHMKFKNLGYFYNYKLGTIESDTFKIIESGMLIDKVV